MAKKRGGSKKTAAKGRAAKGPGGKKGTVKSRGASGATKKVVRKKATRRTKRTVKKKKIAAPLTVVTIVFSNHDYVEVVGSANAPYFNQLIAAYGLATNYHDSGVRPSLPNYLVLVSGDPQYPGIVDLEPTKPPFPVRAANLGTQLQAAKIPWRSYQESMGAPGKLVASGNYNPRHNPFLYFDDIQNGSNGFCAAHNVDFTQFAGDLAGGRYRYMWLSPDMRNSGHDPVNDPVAALKTADAWAQTNIPPILQSRAFKANGILFITWDQAVGRNGTSQTQVPMIIVSSRVKSPGFHSNAKYDHKSYLATIEDLLKLPRLPTVANEPSLLEFLK
jgi:phosphatidylinositol-3-phosphatase